jgi:bifunctional non-homologous end joining protein LigD
MPLARALGSATAPTNATLRIPVMPQLRAEARRAPAPPPPRVAGVAISNPDRAIVEAPGHTKLDVVRYHERLGSWLLREVAPRPIALVKCMEGRFDDCFFQKHPRGGDDGQRPFMRLADVSDVVRAVQNGTYEFHTWGASFPRLERPDRITLDLDPDAALPWSALRDAAERVRRLLERVALRFFVKTTGGKGLHFVLPITRRHTWLEGHDFARALAERIVRDAPHLFTAKAARDARANRIYVDYQRNAEGATAVAAYSLRARPGLPVSMPVGWDELQDDVRGARFNIDNAAEVVARRRGDPWAEYDASRQTLTASMRRALVT